MSGVGAGAAKRTALLGGGTAAAFSVRALTLSLSLARSFSLGGGFSDRVPASESALRDFSWSD